MGRWFGTWPCSSSWLLEILITAAQGWDHWPQLLRTKLPWEGLCLRAAQLPMQFYHLEDCNDEDHLQFTVGRLRWNCRTRMPWGSPVLGELLGKCSQCKSLLPVSHGCVTAHFCFQPWLKKLTLITMVLPGSACLPRSSLTAASLSPTLALTPELVAPPGQNVPMISSEMWRWTQASRRSCEGSGLNSWLSFVSLAQQLLPAREGISLPLGFVWVGTGGVVGMTQIVSLQTCSYFSWWLKAMRRLLFVLNTVFALLCLAVLINWKLTVKPWRLWPGTEKPLLPLEIEAAGRCGVLWPA